MTRISDPDLERLKREIPIRGLVESQGVQLSGQGDNLTGLCPFHDDRSPSLVVSPSKNIWHCFGACRAGGSVIDWVMKAQSVSFLDAVAWLQALKSPSLAAPEAAEAELEAKTEPPLVVSKEDDQAVLRRVVEFYHRVLKDGAHDGLAYLEGRGLGSRELIEAFQLGIADRTLGLRLPGKETKEGREIRGQLQRLGVLRASGHEHLNGSLVVPVFGEDGEILELYGRKLRSTHPTMKAMHLYLPRRPDGRRGVFNLPGVKSSSEVILCEALIDALTFWNAGFRNVTSAYGVEGFTEEMLDAFLRHGVRKVLIAYDRDEAGDRAAERLAPELAARGLEVFRVRFPKGMDANEYATKVKPASKSLDAAIRGAQWVAGERPVAVPSALEPPHDPVTGEVLPTRPSPVEENPSLAAPVIVPPAPPLPELVAADPMKLERKDGEIRLQLGDRQWRLRGLRGDVAPATLKINALVARGPLFFVDTLELYSARQRGAFVKQAAEELQLEELVLKSDLGKILLQLEAVLDEDRQAKEKAATRAPMTEPERAEALALLRDPKLLDRLLEAFDKSGVVGEETNKLVAYLAAVSRKLEAPLAVVIQSSSAAGKSSLMDAVLRLVPEEDRVQYSAMTGQSLFYMGETDLAHKILAIAEEQGAQSASYALKLLQSDGELTIASTGKDPATGRLLTHEYRVQGPVMIFMTTTAVEVDEELLNRCLVLTVDEGADQTAAIHRRQREAQTLEGLLARRERDHLQALYQNAQRLLEPLIVANPFAPKLSFDHRRTRARRDHVKYLTLIRAITFLHQHQRPVRTVSHLGQVVRYIESTEADVAMADRLARTVFGESDELPAQTQRLLEAIATLVRERARADGTEPGTVRFTRREVREASGFSNTVLKKHLGRLEDLEYLRLHGGGRGRTALYELAPLPLDLNLAPLAAHLAPRKPHLAPPRLPVDAPPPGSTQVPEPTTDLARSSELGPPPPIAHLGRGPKNVPKSRLNGQAALGK